MTTELVESNPAKEAYLKAIRADGASDAEVAHMLYLAEKHNLDPLSREIYLMPFTNKKGKKEFVTYVSYFGLMKCAHRSGFFDGIEEELVFSDDGKILGAKARVWTKGSNHPTIAMGLLSEYTKGQFLWNTMPGAMVMKCVKTRAIRDAFNLAGLYSEEEFMVPATQESQPMKQEIKQRKRIEEPIDNEPAFD